MKRVVFSVFLGVFLTVSCSAASSQLSANQRRLIDKVFAQFTTSGSPGCAVGVYRDGKMAYSRGYGLANLEHAVPITPTTVFDIGSTSKQFTAFSILLLEKEGALSLDDDVRKYVPELQPLAKPVTIRHLMLHTSGHRDYLGLWGLSGIRVANWMTQAEAVNLVARQRKGNFAAGDEWLYSNTGYLLLAEIVKSVSGQSLRAFSTARIFEPLGMKHTFFADNHREVIPKRAVGYTAKEGGGFDILMSNYESVGDGALQTTVEDLLLWDANFHEPKVGDRDLLERAQTRGALDDGKKVGYAAGLFIGTYRGFPTVRHGGAWVGYRSELLRFPDEKTSIACLCNLASASPRALAEAVADIVLVKRLGERVRMPSRPVPPAVTVSPEILERLTGFYENKAMEREMLITKQDGGLAGNGQRLRAVANDRFLLSETGLEMNFPAVGPLGVQELHLLSVVLTRVEPPKTADLCDFEGTFFSDELESRWTLSIEDGQLTVRAGTAPLGTLVLVRPDEFVSKRGGVTLRFERTAGVVVRFSVLTGRVKDLVFTRTSN